MAFAHRAVANVFRKYLQPFDLTDSQFTLLSILSKNDGLNQKTLGQIAFLEKSSLHRNLKRLVERGLVSKIDFPVFRISEQGKILLESVIPEWEKAMAEMRQILKPNGENAVQLIVSKITHSN